MNTYIALLRGINVGGNNKLPMKALAALLEEMGLQQVKTYIQSGNVLFQSERTDKTTLGQEITAAIQKAHGFAPQVFLLDSHALAAAIAANPFPEGTAEPKSLHLFFLDGVPKQQGLATLDALKTPTERFALIDQVFYLHAPDGIGRSKLAESIGKGWGVSITARNWRTVSTVFAMAQALATPAST
ncbi:MAG: DUF1697 domain-containing protein [Caldilineaceae bacterium]|nr:DUF1697 domain-containing protein [Caldilineaceae bacterium]